MALAYNYRLYDLQYNLCLTKNVIIIRVDGFGEAEIIKEGK